MLRIASIFSAPTHEGGAPVRKSESRAVRISLLHRAVTLRLWDSFDICRAVLNTSDACGECHTLLETRGGWGGGFLFVMGAYCQLGLGDGEKREVQKREVQAAGGARGAGGRGGARCRRQGSSRMRPCRLPVHV